MASMFSEFQSQCTISLPTIIGLLFYKVPWIISLHFAGQLGSEALAAAALATTLCNITGMSASVGLSSALITLSGQARGHALNRTYRNSNISNHEINGKGIIDDESTKLTENSTLLDGGKREFDVVCTDESKCSSHDTQRDFSTCSEESNSPLLALVFLYRGLMVSLIIAIPIGFWWMKGVDSVLLIMGQSEKLSSMTSEYLQILVPGFWSYTINWTTNAWLQSVDMANVPACSALIGLILHIPTNILFVNILDFGYKGVALATITFQMIQTFILYTYLFCTERGRDRILKSIGVEDLHRNSIFSWAEVKMATSSFQGFKQYLGLGVPGMIAISEWWASECCIFLAGTINPYPDYALGAMSIYQSINTFCFIFPIGCSTASSARVGMFLGKNQPSLARNSAQTGLFSASVISLFVGFVLFFNDHKIFPSLFTTDENVLSQCSSVIPFLAMYVFADGIQCGLQGAIKGCGKQCVIAPIVLFSYWIVGVPLSYYCTFLKNDDNMECGTKDLCGVRGLVFGLLVGTWIHMLLSLGVFVFVINWTNEALLAQERLTNAHKDVQGMDVNDRIV